MFEFFKFGFMPGVFHFLFMATLPLAILSAINGGYLTAAIIMFIFAPLFRNLRNRSVGLY
tara:strand:+ start:322 stop:501 length:180 start_codon:yes stop_codon:yes gene_type:complete